MNSDIAALIERIEAASGPGRELDAHISFLIGDHKIVSRSSGWAIFEAPFEQGNWAAASGCKSYDDAISMLASFLSLPAYTTSIDAAVALVERMLPGQQWTLGQNIHHRYWLCTLNVISGDPEGVTAMASSHAAPTPPLAVLAALLRALQHQEPSHAE